MLRRLLPLAVLTLAVALCPAQAGIVINEIMYNTPGSPDVEYVELFNSGPGSHNLTGWYMLDDDNQHPKCMLAGTLAPGEYLVIAGFISQFNATYPGVSNVNPNPFDSAVVGQGFSLGNGGDQIRIFDSLDLLVDTVTFTDLPPWPTAADGTGPSLELKSPALDNALPSSWGASEPQTPGGTPGEQNSIFLPDAPPSIVSVLRSIPLPKSTDTVVIAAEVTDNTGVSAVDLYVDSGSGFAPTVMLDDGLHGDGASGDSVYGASIAPKPTGTLVRYYVSAVDGVAQTTTLPADAPTGYFAYTVGHVVPTLRINELLASNQNGIKDELGESEDWVEILNRGSVSVNVGGMYLTDDTLTTKFKLPAQSLAPGQSLIVWCDDDVPQGPLHANFNLDKVRGSIGLYETTNHGNVPIHTLTYGPQTTDIAFGYRPDDADAPEYLNPPTPGTSNNVAALFSPVCINEFLTASSVAAPDFIELYNRGSLPVDLSGWHLSDNAELPTKHTFPGGTSIGVGDFLTVDQVALGFGLAAGGTEVILLTQPDGLTGRDYFDYGPQTSDVSQGRFADGTPNWHFFATVTPDSANSCAGAGPAPGLVSNLRFNSKSVLTWNATAGATAYDVVRGSLLNLSASDGNFALAVTGCLENNSADASSFDSAIPASGQARFYLVRATNGSCGFGSYEDGSAAQVGTPDEGIADAPATCP